jgi:hypothetical protein
MFTPINRGAEWNTPIQCFLIVNRGTIEETQRSSQLSLGVQKGKVFDVLFLFSIGLQTKTSNRYNYKWRWWKERRIPRRPFGMPCFSPLGFCTWVRNRPWGLTRKIGLKTLRRRKRQVPLLRADTHPSTETQRTKTRHPKWPSRYPSFFPPPPFIVITI